MGAMPSGSPAQHQHLHLHDGRYAGNGSRDDGRMMPGMDPALMGGMMPGMDPAMMGA